LRSISDNGRTSEYVYDHAGRRLITRGKQGATIIPHGAKLQGVRGVERACPG